MWVTNNVPENVNMDNAPEWAKFLVRVDCYSDTPLIAWVNDTDTLYQYLPGYAGSQPDNWVGKGDFINAGWSEHVTVIAEFLTTKDALPPPENTLFVFMEGERQVRVEKSGMGKMVFMNISQHVPGLDNQTVGVHMDPDDALRVAHDLRRWAMDIKRKEKE